MKKVCSILTILVVLVTLIHTIAYAEKLDLSSLPAIPSEGDVWDGSTEQPTKTVNIDGTDFFEITKCAQLAYVAQTGGEWLERNYILANNLILNDVVLEWDENGNLLNDLTLLKEWTPIGNKEKGFTGIFCGSNYCISGLYVAEDMDYLGLFGNSLGEISGILLVNSAVYGSGNVGGIAGHAKSISDCVFCGVIVGDTYVGGIVGAGSASDCISYGLVCGYLQYAGGICGSADYTKIVNCDNYCSVKGNSFVGGVCGDHWPYISNCFNYGSVKGNKTVGGICGGGVEPVRECANFGIVIGTDCVGGIGGWVNDGIQNCYNASAVVGEKNVGGIIGMPTNNSRSYITNCYSIGRVICSSSENSCGAIIGSTLWNQVSVSSCYYLNENGTKGCGGIDSAEMEPQGVSSKTDNEMRQQTTYEGWDFSKIWGINAELQDGLPFLAEQDVEHIKLNGLIIDESMLKLAAGDSSYLMALPSPVTVYLPDLSWESSDTAVASVNASGKVTAISQGTATITVSGGGFSYSCEVMVTPRAGSEYLIGSLKVRDRDGALLSDIPSGVFLITVPVTKMVDGGNAMVLLAAYNAQGQYKGLLYINLSGVSQGSTIEFTLPFDNNDGSITSIKAFAIASFSNATPLGEPAAFETER